MKTNLRIIINNETRYKKLIVDKETDLAMNCLLDDNHFTSHQTHIWQVSSGSQGDKLYLKIQQNFRTDTIMV